MPPRGVPNVHDAPSPPRDTSPACCNTSRNAPVAVVGGVSV
jgi:hypothetical protein